MGLNVVIEFNQLDHHLLVHVEFLKLIVVLIIVFLVMGIDA